MAKWLRRIGGAVGMGLAWAVVWGPLAVLIGLRVDPDGSMDEMWVAVGAYSGFLCGVVFRAVVGIAERPRGLGEVPLPRAGIWGATAGLLVSVLPFALGDPAVDIPLWLLAAVAIGCITLLSALSAVAAAAWARHAARKRWNAGSPAAPPRSA